MIKGYKIITHNDIEKPLAAYHEQGAKRGKYLGFKSMQRFYSMREDGCTDWTGFPQSGKTELLLESLFNTSSFYGWKHLLLAPDIGDAIEKMAILIHKASGKTFDKRYSNTIDLQEVWKHSSWLLEHFLLLEKTDARAKITPIEFWKYAVLLKKERGGDLHTATIDSWKDLDHDYQPYGGNIALYLSDVLPIRNHLSEEHNIHFHTVIHPKTPRRDKRTGKIAHPQVDDMEGGAQWNNSGKVIISVHRATYETKVADVQMLKVKPKVIGKRGFFTINFDPAKSRYFDIQDKTGAMIYAEAKEPEVKFDHNHDVIKTEASVPVVVDFSEPKNTGDGVSYSDDEPF